MRENYTKLKLSFDSSLLAVLNVADDSREELANSRKDSH
jgi:hypothetical protein